MVGDLDDADPAALARARRRAAFFAALGPDQLPEVAAQAIDTCAAAVEASLKAEPARGVIEDVVTAWAEAQAVVQADGHDLREVLVQELHALAADALGDLPVRQRRGLWAQLEPIESGERGDLWDRDGAEHFDPLGAWPGSMDTAEQRIVRRVLAALAVTP